MTTLLSLTAAIRHARKYGSVWGAHTAWTVVVPCRAEDPTGLCTEAHVCGWEKARNVLTANRSYIALAALGRLGLGTEEAVDRAVYGMCIPHRDLVNVVKYALRASEAH